MRAGERVSHQRREARVWLGRDRHTKAKRKPEHRRNRIYFSASACEFFLQSGRNRCVAHRLLFFAVGTWRMGKNSRRSNRVLWNWSQQVSEMNDKANQAF